MNDYDYENFKAFMNHFNVGDPFTNLENRARTFDIIETLDVIEEAVSSMDQCTLATNMLQAIGIKTK
jgi:hypothetical protein